MSSGFESMLQFGLLGIVPYDYLRNTYSNRAKSMINSVFTDCAFTGSIAFMADRIETLIPKKSSLKELVKIQ